MNEKRSTDSEKGVPSKNNISHNINTESPQSPELICNICGHNAFGVGPGGRMSRAGNNPQCKGCHSLERHRVYRKIFSQLINDNYKQRSLLQFSNDKTVDPKWFKTHEVSIYGGTNSLDLQKIDRQSGQYDIVMCNHVLEHVPYDNAALNELLRVTKDDGFVFLTVPAPLAIERTNDWGYPRKEQHGHYRLYGKDFVNILKKYLPAAWILSKTEIDDVTKTQDIVFFISKTKEGLEGVRGTLGDVTLHQQGNDLN